MFRNALKTECLSESDESSISDCVNIAVIAVKFRIFTKPFSFLESIFLPKNPNLKTTAADLKAYGNLKLERTVIGLLL